MNPPDYSILTRPPWVSVTNRNPGTSGISQPYLVCLADGSMLVANWMNIGDWDFEPSSPITHWRPLPPPPHGPADNPDSDKPAYIIGDSLSNAELVDAITTAHGRSGTSSDLQLAHFNHLRCLLEIQRARAAACSLSPLVPVPQ